MHVYSRLGVLDVSGEFSPMNSACSYTDQNANGLAPGFPGCQMHGSEFLLGQDFYVCCNVPLRRV